MPDQVTLDVIDRPAGGVLSALRRASALAKAPTPRRTALIRLGTSRFVTRVRPAPTIHRVALLAGWAADADVEGEWSASLASLAAGAREHWHVHGEVVRAAFTGPWLGWSPATAGARPLADDEPALILISGNLRARYVRPFLRDAVGAVGRAFDHPGYLGGLGVNSAPLNTTSCSAWRTYADARDYAFADGAHAEAMRRDRAEARHRTEWFLRIRPLREHGTLNGAAPFAELLAAPVAA